jgi:hypothetical protein
LGRYVPRILKMTMIAGCVQIGPGTLTRSESERARECVETSGEGERFLAREREAATGDGEREWLLQLAKLQGEEKSG